MKSKMFSKKGNTAGFAANGEAVAGCYSRNAASWIVWTESDQPGGAAMSLINGRRKMFATGAEADAYAASLICPKQTEARKWW